MGVATGNDWQAEIGLFLWYYKYYSKISMTYGEHHWKIGHAEKYTITKSKQKKYDDKNGLFMVKDV